MSGSARKRVPQFTHNEKYNLVRIVEKYFAIVDSKKIDGQSLRIKAAKWDQIAKEFNATSQHLFRTHKVLKCLWENLKKNARTIIAREKQNVVGTGGEPSKKMKYSPILERVISMVRAQSEGFSNPYDADYLENSLEQNKIDVCSTVVQNRSSFSPKLLLKPISVLLRNNDGTVDNQGQIQSSIDDRHEVEEVVTALPTQRKLVDKPLLATRRRCPKIGGDDALNLSCEEETTEHKLKLKILQLNVEQEQEKLKQEKEKTTQQELQTAILRKQLDNLQ